jgi:hypothetical protein
MLSLGSGEAIILLRVVLCLRPPGLRSRLNRRCSETPLREASDEAWTRACLLSWLAGGPARGDLAHGSSFVDFSLKGRDRVFDLQRAFALIWVPLIVVPDNSPRAYGGVGILLQRLYVGYATEALACFLVAFFQGVRASAPAGCIP